VARLVRAGSAGAGAAGLTSHRATCAAAAALRLDLLGGASAALAGAAPLDIRSDLLLPPLSICTEIPSTLAVHGVGGGGSAPSTAGWPVAGGTPMKRRTSHDHVHPLDAQ